MRRGSDRELERGPSLDVMEPWHTEEIEAGPKSQYLMRGASPHNFGESPEGSDVVGGDESGFDFNLAGWTRGDPPNPVPRGFRAETKRAGPFNLYPYYRLVAVPAASATPRSRRRPMKRRRAPVVKRPAIPGIAPAVTAPAAGPDDGEEDYEGGDEDELHGYVGPESSGILGATFPPSVPSEPSEGASTLESRSPFGASAALASFATPSTPSPVPTRPVPTTPFGSHPLVRGSRRDVSVKGDEVGAGRSSGTIVVTTDSADLFIFVNGTERGTATTRQPLRLSVGPGTAIVEAYTDRGRPAEPYFFVARSSVMVRPGQTVNLPFNVASAAFAESGYWTDLTRQGENLRAPDWVEVGTLPEAIARIQAAARDFQALPIIGTGTGGPGDFRTLAYRGMTSGRYNRQRAWDLVRVYGEKWGRAMSALVFIDEVDDDEALINQAASEVRDRVNDCRNLVRAATGT